MVKNDGISFGNHRWRVLDIQDDRALIITDDIIGLRWYHDEFVDVTWADSALRKYLHHEFHNTFSPREKARIMAVTNENHDNPWFGTRGGEKTVDSVFLLSLDEVCTYFGDSRVKLQCKGPRKWLIDDENNEMRQAKYRNDFHWWRLRSPGYYGRTAASVSVDGHVYVRGNGVHGRPRDGGGLRPALWLVHDENR